MAREPFYYIKDRKETTILDNILITRATAIRGPRIRIRPSTDTIPARIIRETIKEVAIRLNI